MFRAFDPDRDRLVAVKFFRLDLPPERVHQLVAEFERLIAAGVTHPAAVAPVATGIEGVAAYLAQDYVAAESLDITLRHGPMPVADALRVATQLAGALDAAAAVQIGHGVLHPRDVLLSADEARLTGLGIAQAVEHVGVPAQVRRPYTAPERAVGSDWGRRADVFGLAALVHEMLWARRVAATGDEAAHSLTEIADGDLPRLRAAFGRALADNPAERFGTALEFAGALEEAFSSRQSAVASQQSAVASQQSAVGSRRSAKSRLPTGRLLTADRQLLTADRRLPTTDHRLASEPRLPLEAPPGAPGEKAGNDESAMAGVTAAVENAEEAVEKEPEPVATPGDLDLRLPVVPPELMDSYRPADGVPAEERSRSAIAPLAFALVIGAALGFAAGFGVGTWGRSTDQSDPTLSDPKVVSNTSNAGTVAATGKAREFTEAETDLPVATPKAAAPTTAPKAAPAAPIVGSLLVRSTPLGAQVVVDGREYGRTPVTVGSLSRGTHKVRVTRDGYVADERVVTITPAQRAHSVTARLSPERAAPVAKAVNPAKVTTAAGAANATKPAGAAPLTIESRPAGAKVFIDGRLVGTTPLVVPGVAVGEHALHLDHDGYQRWSSAIRIVTSERNRVTASLDR